MSEESDNGILKSINKTLKDRFGSLMYGTFIISWGIWNWTALYTTFFIDQDLIFQKFGQLKIEYLKCLYSNSYIIRDFDIGIFWTNFLLLLLFPFISSLIIVWILSWADRCFLKKGYENKLKSDEIESKYKIKFFALGKKESEAETKTVEQKIEKVSMEKMLATEMSDEDRWDLEFKQMESGSNFGNIMKYFLQCLYEHNGWVEDGQFRKQPEFIVFLDVNNLISFVKGNRDHIESTEKGKYFLRLHTRENSKWY